jgi:hypothetical protein
MQSEPTSPRVWPWIVATAALASCIAFPCGVGTGWLGRGAGVAPAGDKGQAKADGGAGKKDAPVVPVAKGDVEQWTWQDLQDHLAAKGMKTDRGQGRLGMWFCAPGDGKPLHHGEIENMENGFSLRSKGEPSSSLAPYTFVAIDFGSSAAATKEAARIKDAEQRDVVVSGRFIMQGRKETRDKIKPLLP